MDKGFMPVSIGDTILRAETAAIVFGRCVGAGLKEKHMEDIKDTILGILSRKKLKGDVYLEENKKTECTRSRTERLTGPWRQTPSEPACGSLRT